MIGRLSERLRKNLTKVDAWFEERRRLYPPPLYLSVDIRNSVHKLAVVDTNAFPAGFNNLCPKYCELLTRTFREHIREFYPGAEKILILPEDHTRNRFYLDNVMRIRDALNLGGFEARVGTANPELREGSAVMSGTKGELTLYRIERSGSKITASDFEPDLIVSNNDFSDEEPGLLMGLDIPVTPVPELGWYRRRKHEHFTIMNELIREFAEVADVDPFEISTRFSMVDDVDFTSDEGREKVAKEVDATLSSLREEYAGRGIEERPFLFLKHNSGTYGMAMMTARSGDEIREARRKTRVKMSTGKAKVKVTQTFIQEGIPTRDFMDDGSPMEPVIYLVGDRPVGGFYRINPTRGDRDNLNARGMDFKRLCFHQVETEKPELLGENCKDAADLMLAYGTLGRLAAAALAIEKKRLEEEK